MCVCYRQYFSRMTTVPRSYCELADDYGDGDTQSGNDSDYNPELDCNMESELESDENASVFNSDPLPSAIVPTFDDCIQPACVASSDSAVVEELGVAVAEEVVVSAPDVVSPPSSKLTRKRKRKPEQWKANVRKRLVESGKSYISRRGKIVAEKSMKNTCALSCRKKCSESITDTTCENIFSGFYNLTSADKRHFLSKSTTYCETKRPTNKSASSRRKMSYAYFLSVEGSNVQVCKKFFLNVLQISQTQVYSVHKAIDKTTGILSSSKVGKHAKKVVAKSAKNLVHKHIQSIPTLESHYCRANTQRTFFEDRTLNITKLYALYKDWLPQNEVPVKESMYRKIFNCCYNYAFSPPKKDICDTCSLFEAKKKSGVVSEEEELNFEMHQHEKIRVRKERDKDREVSDTLVLCFDLENVFTLPQCGVSSFFYKRKLTGYNLTAHAQLRTDGHVKKKYYSAIWNEAQAGRGGDIIASGLILILKRVARDFPNSYDYVTWSDSCVPQNRNQMMAFAIQHFLQTQVTSSVKCITMKFCTPGHSSIQEVDNLHSQIEKRKRLVEFYSPISLIRSVLLRVNPNMTVIQMPKDSFKQYSLHSAEIQYSAIPFSTVTVLKFDRSRALDVEYMNGIEDDEAHTAHLKRKQLRKTRAGAKAQLQMTDFTVILSLAAKPAELSIEKKRDIKSMMEYMPEQDQQFYKNLLKI